MRGAEGFYDLLLETDDAPLREERDSENIL